MATTYVPLYTTTLTSAASSVTISPISGAYTDLVVVVSGATTSGANNCRYYFNGDNTSGLYSRTTLTGNGTSAISSRGTASNYAYAADATTTQSANIINVMNYANTTTFKTAISRGGAGNNATTTRVNLWRNTAAITSITVDTDGSTWLAGSTFSLYGIANAAIAGGAKATGGDIVATDGTYWYHAFKASGTFTPTSALSCDYLVIAGGGGGGNAGGGAGGYRLISSQSLTATGYSVTVGAGGAGGVPGVAGSNSVFNSTTSTGGGGGAVNGGNAGNGGSGGGASVVGSTVGSAGTGTSGQGNNGGSGTAVAAGNYVSGGGGGAGAAGGNTVGLTCGAGGAGKNSESSWLSVTGTGVSGYIAGGGGAAGNTTTSAGGAGGGGQGDNGTTGNGIANTGSGGGGGYAAYLGNGGSGLVIVRYAI